jgi:hypothetical protein
VNPPFFGKKCSILWLPKLINAIGVRMPDIFPIPPPPFLSVFTVVNKKNKDL